MLGVCYYPEHWSELLWAQDAKEMTELGIVYVRIGEFCWSRIEPTENQYTFQWLDRAIDTLAKAGLKIIMCTPTATPPKWLIEKYPDILPVDIYTGQVRAFGSRRHYDFSSKNYTKEAMRITEVLTKRYGTNKSVVGWQTDNEIGCHDTTHSGSSNAKNAFQVWCTAKYHTIENLNTLWGNVFWSMEYQDFKQIELPMLAVTETNPAHQLAYRRFSSDLVISFHNKMVNIIKNNTVDQFVTHNFIPMSDTQTDNFLLASNLDFVSYDNYPLGRSDLFFSTLTAKEFKPYMRTGHPDFSSYSFDQVRGLLDKNFWIMEQQPGPVNWAHHNPRPEKGMVRLWTWQAFAHGANCVSYFRWRQVAFAQEQMHSGIKRVDNSKSIAWNEIQQVRQEIDKLLIIDEYINIRVAIVTGTLNQWITEIERQGDSYNHQKVEFTYYSVLRQLGLEVDFISVNSDLTKYDLIIAPCLPIIPDSFITKCKKTKAHLVFGPRSGSKTDEFSLSPNLAPGPLQTLLPIQILSIETIRPDCSETLSYNNKLFESKCWREELSISKEVIVVAHYHDKSPAIIRHKNISYLSTLTCSSFLLAFFENLCCELDIEILKLPKDMRITKRNNIAFVFNYAGYEQQFPVSEIGKFLIGNETLGPYDVAILKLNK